MKPNRPILTYLPVFCLFCLIFMLVMLAMEPTLNEEKPVIRENLTTETRDTAMDWWVRLRTSDKHREAVGETIK